MLALLLLQLAAQYPQHRVFSQPNLSHDPAFDFSLAVAPPSGLGMPAECSGTKAAPAKGGTLSFTRLSAATCIKSDGTGVVLSSNQLAIQNCPGCGATGPLGFIDERTATNLLLQSGNIDPATFPATWSAVGTATVTPNDSPGIFSGEPFSKIAAAASGDGFAQAITTTAARKYGYSCWLKAGTASAVSMKLTGTGSSAGDRTCNKTITSTATRFGCSTTIAYGGTLTALTAQVIANGVTGTFSATSCQVESDAYWVQGNITSYIPTTVAAATRASTGWNSGPFGVADTSGCFSYSWRQIQYDAELSTAAEIGRAGSAFIRGNSNSSLRAFVFDSTNQLDSTGGAGSAFGATRRVIATWSGSTQTIATDTGGTGSGAYDGTMSIGTIRFGNDDGAGANQGYNWFTDIQLDSTPSRCR